jgi:lipid II:glycine glycyltransferase (peptidoglycan interpeptide bridge formation enzyme)
LRVLLEVFSDRTDLMLVYADDKAVCGVLSFQFRDQLLPYYAGAGSAAPRLAANNFMYWELMKYAIGAGLKVFDFGRSKKGTGAYAFKTQWHMTVEPLQYQVHLVQRASMPDFSPLNPRIQAATRVWQHLPVAATKIIGPRVVRWFP